MGVDTKGLVLTNEKDVFRVIGPLVKVINQYTASKKIGGRLVQSDVTNMRISTDIKSVSLHFDVAHNDKITPRMMFVCFDCDADFHEKYQSKGISMSIGCWGESVEIMRQCISTLAYSLKGQALLNENDSLDVGYIEICDYRFE